MNDMRAAAFIDNGYLAMILKHEFDEARLDFRKFSDLLVGPPLVTVSHAPNVTPVLASGQQGEWLTQRGRFRSEEPVAHSPCRNRL
jgi:hypothetical protein